MAGNALPIAVKGFQLAGADATKMTVDVSFLKENIDFTPMYSKTTKCGGQPALLSITFAPVSFAMLKTSQIDGTNNVCTSMIAQGALAGKAKKVKIDQQAAILVDSTTTAATATNGSYVQFTCLWSNSSSGASGSDTVTVWIKDAGQNKVKGV